MITSSLFSQEENLILKGSIEEGTVRAIVHKNAKDQNLPLEGVDILVLEGDVIVKKFRSDKSGNYRVTMAPNRTYSITFQKEGYLDKTFVIDGKKYRDNQSRAHMLESDVALFRDLNDPVIREYVQHPSAKCRYYRNRNEFRWDMMYAESQQKEFLKLLEAATVAELGDK